MGVHDEELLEYVDELMKASGKTDRMEISQSLEGPHWKESYSYDERGNITSKSTAWGSIEYRYDGENRQLGAGNRVFEYDRNGNRIRESLGDFEANYFYDAENRLEGLNFNRDGFIGDYGVGVHQVLTYSYDALGRRTGRRELPMTHEISEDVFKADMAFGLVSRPQDHLAESYQYDGLSFDMIGEWIEREDRPVIDTGEWKEYYRPAFETLRAGKRLVLRSKLENHYTSSMKNYYGQDVLGSAVVLFNRDGRVDQRMHYDSWGKETSGNLHEMDSAGYNGKRRDMMTGMYDYGFRDYFPEAQRWMTVDPIRDGTNWYAYVGNDPINFIDPLGLSAASPENDGDVVDEVENVLDETSVEEVTDYSDNGLGLPDDSSSQGSSDTSAGLARGVEVLAGAEAITLGTTTAGIGGITLAAGMGAGSAVAIVGGVIAGGALIIGGGIVIFVGIDLLVEDRDLISEVLDMISNSTK